MVQDVHDADETWDEGAETSDTEHRQFGAGETLRHERERQGLELSQVAAETRIPERHLVAIENGDFAALPARTYAVGFSRTYAKMLGIDEKDITAKVREDLSVSSTSFNEHPAKFEPGDPARVPSRSLAWVGIIAAVLLLGGIFAFYRSYFAPGMGPAPLTEETPVAAATSDPTAAQAAAANTPDPEGEVVFTALEDGVWAKFYDASGERLYEAQMSKGETYALPRDAEGPQIWTGRPDAFAITIAGESVPKLAEDDFVMRDQPISATALLAREDTGAAAANTAAGENAGPAL